MNDLLQIFDEGFKVNSRIGDVYLWYRSKNTKNIFNVIDANKNELRDEYTQIISKISKIKVRNQTIEKILSYKENQNLWHMSLIAEKCPIKTPEISEIIKLFASAFFATVLSKKSFSSIGVFVKLNNASKSSSF